MNELMRQLLFLPEQGSAYAQQVDRLHYFVITMTMLGFTGVAAAVLWFVIRYRRRAEGESTPTVEPRALHEVLFVGGPLALFLLWFAIGYPLFVRLQTPPREAMDVYVMGKKWMWKFAYAGGPSGADTLYVPVGRPVRLLITSRDVIHSFYLPAFRLKQDAVPGRYTQTWFQADRPGRYEIFCAEYCGLGHSAMLGELVVMEAAKFDAWLSEARRSPVVAAAQDSAQEAASPVTTLSEQGRRLAAEYGCFKCHTVDGTRHIGPSWLDLYLRKEPLEGGGTVVADEGYLTESMMDPRAKVVKGFQPVMPTFQGRIPGPEVAAIVEFIKTLRTDAVRPEPTKARAYEPVPGFDPTQSR
jgi:cytochrome c oxidase subunit II